MCALVHSGQRRWVCLSAGVGDGDGRVRARHKAGWRRLSEPPKVGRQVGRRNQRDWGIGDFNFDAQSTPHASHTVPSPRAGRARAVARRPTSSGYFLAGLLPGGSEQAPPPPKAMLPRPLQTLLVLPHLMMIMPAAATYVTDANISTAVAAWRADPAAAEASYGHMGTWDTSEVTTMAELFLDCDSNEDISAWNTAQVTSMYGMFWRATWFNQPLESVGRVEGN